MDRPVVDKLRKPAPGAAHTPERERALSRLAGGVWLMTASHERDRAGVVVRWVQRAGMEPPLVSVAMRKGHPVEPLIRDSRAFALNLLTPELASLERRFSNGLAERFGDPFDTIETDRLSTRSPCLRRAPVSIDCELFRHIDLEIESCVYIGLVLATRST